MLRSGSAITSSTLSIINPSIGIVTSSSRALLASIAILITNEYTSKFKTRYTKSREWTIFITLLYEKTLKKSIVDKKIDDKEALEFKKIIIFTLMKEKKS